MVIRICFITILLLASAVVKSQDYLVTPSTNLQLLPSSLGIEKLRNRDKLNIQKDSIIYQFDTLGLPFVDDFSSNHLIRRVINTADPRLSDTLIYKLYQGGQVVRDTNGFVTDSTFYYQIGQDSSIISKMELFAGQVNVFDLNVFPPNSSPRDVFRHYNIYDTVNIPPDTIAKAANLFQDSARFYFVEKDSNVFYTDRKVFINNSFPINPPTIGVATFDGLNENGIPYDIEDKDSEIADFLTSVPLNLNAVTDTVYLSFYFQPKGIAIDGPEAEDSLVVDFYDAQEDEWRTVWSTAGFTADTFTYVMLKVDSIFLQNGFQFRFRAYANVSGAYDQWHLDYIYLDDQRTKNDVDRKDLAFVNPPSPLLKDFFAMPWWHFKPNPGNFMVDNLDNNLVRNLFDGGLNVYNKVQILDTVNNSVFYRHPPNDQFSIIDPLGTLSFSYPINFAFNPNYIDSTGTLEAILDIDFRPSPFEQKDLIPGNDTLRSKAILENYYAYDDGTAEAGYGINPNQGSGALETFVAVEYILPFADSIGGVQIYFLPQRNFFSEAPITSQSFELMIWSSLSPSSVIYKKEKNFNPIYSDDHALVTYWLDTLINVPQRFYVGFRSVGPLSLNVGYDLNNNNRDKVYWSQDGQSWSNPTGGTILDGTPMIRPVFRKKEWGVGIKENKSEKEDISVYPNPTKRLLNVDINSLNREVEFQIFDLQGKVHLRGRLNSSIIDVSSLINGVYILRVNTSDHKYFNKKIVISR
jgi:hypothetical protein